MLIVILFIVRLFFLAVADTVAWCAGHLVVAILAVLLGRVLWTFIKPYRMCRWCRPGGLIGGSILFRLAGTSVPLRRRSRGTCWRCKGRRLTRRLGAYHAHKLRLSLIQAWAERGDER